MPLANVLNHKTSTLITHFTTYFTTGANVPLAKDCIGSEVESLVNGLKDGQVSLCTHCHDASAMILRISLVLSEIP